MSLAMVLANPYGIVMTADRRLTLKPKKTYDNMYVLYPTLSHQQKLFMTKSGHGIAYVGDLTLSNGTPATIIIKDVISKFTNPTAPVAEELSILKDRLIQYTNNNCSVLIGAGINDNRHEIFKTNLSNQSIESITDKDGFCIMAEGDYIIANMLMSGQHDTSNCLTFPLQEGIDYLRFINRTTSKLQYYNGELQSISEECDVLVIENDGAKWITSQDHLT